MIIGHCLLLNFLANKFSAVPTPTNIPPNIHAKNLSSVSAGNSSNIFKNIDKSTVPISDFTKRFCLF